MARDKAVLIQTGKTLLALLADAVNGANGADSECCPWCYSEDHPETRHTADCKAVKALKTARRLFR